MGAAAACMGNPCGHPFAGRTRTDAPFGASSYLQSVSALRGGRRRTHAVRCRRGRCVAGEAAFDPASGKRAVRVAAPVATVFPCRLAGLTVTIILNNRGNPAGKLADAELHFTEGVLAGLKLIGFSVWERRGGTGRNVTFPATPSKQDALQGALTVAP